MRCSEEASTNRSRVQRADDLVKRRPLTLLGTHLRADGDEPSGSRRYLGSTKRWSEWAVITANKGGTTG
jgi:hypothetical protein